jgi:geranylgeranyl pyrophosphate synthase
VANASEAQVRDLEAWGLKFGIAFQHADDILDDDQKSLRGAGARAGRSARRRVRRARRPVRRARRGAARAVGWVKDRAHAAAAGVKAD